MSLTRERLVSFIALMVVFAFLLLRPGIFGQLYTTLGLAVIGFVTLLSLIFLNRANARPPDTWFFMSLLAFWIFLLLFGVLGESNLDFLFKAVTSNLLFVAGLCFFVLCHRDISLLVIKYYIYLLSILGFSSAISFCLFLFGVGVPNIELMNVDIGYEAPSLLLFPFSVLYHDMHSGSLNVLRFQSVFRESGIAQAFYIWAAVVSYYCGLKRWVVLGQLFGVLMAFSTTGIAIFLVVAMLIKLSEYISSVSNKLKAAVISLGMFLFPALLALVGYLVAYIPYFGVVSKIETHEASITDRLPYLSDLSFLGSGFYSSDVANGGINLLKASESIGVLLTLCYMFMYTVMCWFGSPRKDGFKVFVAILPFFTTGLLAQPIVDAPLIFILLFLTRMACWRDCSYSHK